MVLGHLMVNDLFSIAETTLVLRKASPITSLEGGREMDRRMGEKKGGEK